MKKRRNWQPVALGLIMAILIAGGVLYYVAGRHTTPSTLLQPGQRYTTYQCPYGERKAFVLADSTVVTLNSRARLYVPDGFPQTKREVILDGEAFFNVRQIMQRPFTLQTDKLNVHTAISHFRIRSLEKQSGATLYLLAGAANVGKSYHSDTDNQREDLAAGEMILANKDIDLMEKETFTLAEQQDCLAGKLVFDNTPLPAAFKKMEDWFGVEVEVKGGRSISKAVSGVFRNDSLQDMLAVLGDSIGFSYRITRDKVVIKF